MFLETIQIWYWTDVSAISSCKFRIFWFFFASFHAVQGCFSKKVICQDWTCDYSKDKLATRESKSVACIIYMLPSKCCLVKKTGTLAGKHHILHESTTENWDKAAVSRPIFEKIMHLEKTSTFCSELCTVTFSNM